MREEKERSSLEELLALLDQRIRELVAASYLTDKQKIALIKEAMIIIKDDPQPI